jgi:hypothetical protein
MGEEESSLHLCTTQGVVKGDADCALQICNSVTFVTCFVQLYENEPYPHKNIAWRIEQFEFIASTNVNICVYSDQYTRPFLEEYSIARFPHVKLLELETSYKETPIYQACLDHEFKLPERRYEAKDTVEYMALMNAKIEFINDAIEKNPFGSTTFAWMDFSMAYLFSNKSESLAHLRSLGDRSVTKPLMAVPGCWQPIPPDNNSAILNNIHWRFCGTFFMGDVESLRKFFRLYREHFPRFLEKDKTLVWEVNFWAWLEANTDWNPQWYLSDHNDQIVHIPEAFFL